ncbi:efflux RND transporter periplasmic adaptor subunit [Aliikangiella coralliicola]|uniref:HlyD family efflux transporter periplasmic adaptor subunit n=1 Tax=Aliikangiella coralliicola TaxID=2592383 RepID=A0A545UH81_9GAMM|nr:HlyD family efflux transporter periplasmic adaptor subunit [Aliikangiella coralliicola]TQV88820.1 HlyD family efflux transporter periplasmic adaptor subunit [Aliikangiella coralliicola]
MDIIKPSVDRSSFTFLQKFSALLFLIIFLLAFAVDDRLNTVTIHRSEILVDEVKVGDLEVVVDGYGKLTPAKQKLVTAPATATVKEILLKPGATVSTGSLIVVLENAELLQQVENERQRLDELRANLRQLEVNQKRELLSEDISLTEVTSRYESVRLKRIAEEKLVEQGVFSRLNFEQLLLEESTLKGKIDIQTEQRVQLTKVHQEAVSIQREKIKLQQRKHLLAEKLLSQLEVRADFDGILQRLSVELGQSLQAGQEIALVGSISEQIAELRVPQSQAHQIVVGLKVLISTLNEKFEGRVIRIDPVVDKNTVTVDIQLPGNLPSSVRPQSAVDGKIITDNLNNVLYIERPANSHSNSEGEIYLLDRSFQSARLKKIKFGRRAGRYIEIISGVTQGEKLILSDMSNYKTTNTTLVVES